MALGTVMASNESDDLLTSWRDRLGASMIRHPFWTAVAWAASFYLLMAVFQLGSYAVWSGSTVPLLVNLAMLVPVSIFYGAMMSRWARSNPIARSRADADQLRRLRAAARAVRQGRPVDLDPESGELLARQAEHDARNLRRMRPVIPFVGVIIALPGAVPAVLSAWPLAVLTWIVAAAVTGLVWWFFRRGLRLAGSLVEAGREAASANNECD